MPKEAKRKSNKKGKSEKIGWWNAEKGLWVVKLPMYLAERWAQSPSDMNVGKMVVTTPHGQVPKVVFKQEYIDPETKIPTDYEFHMSNTPQPKLGVLIIEPPEETSAANTEQAQDELYLEGYMEQRLECRPMLDSTYTNMKQEKLKNLAEPKRMTQSLDKLVNNFKPIANHAHNIKYAERKKALGRKVRDKKEVVHELLFKAFDKHQYYNTADLVNITNQPITFLKEILNDLCIYNKERNSKHQFMWELKPEYRHYGASEAEAD